MPDSERNAGNIAAIDAPVGNPARASRIPAGRLGEGEWRLWRDRAQLPPGRQLAADEQLLAAAVAGSLPATIRIWQNRDALVVSPRDTHLPHYSQAAAVLAAGGLPVIQRRSGGTAVLHGPGIVNISLVYRVPGEAPLNIRESYQLLCAPLAEFLARRGIETSLAAVPGAFCDGRYNLGVAGRKLAGTAQRVRKTPGGCAVLSHMSVLVHTDLAHFDATINRFYELAGADFRVTPGRSVCISSLLADYAGEDGAAAFVTDLVAGLRGGSEN